MPIRTYWAPVDFSFFEQVFESLAGVGGGGRRGVKGIDADDEGMARGSLPGRRGPVGGSGFGERNDIAGGGGGLP